MAEGISLKDICADESMPKPSTIGQWRAKHPEFAALYVHARELAGDAEADLAKQYSNQTHVQLPNGMFVAIDANRSRLMADTAKWRAAKLYPKNYGDKLNVEHSGSITFTDATNEDLLAELMDLMSSGRMVLPEGAQLVADPEPESEAWSPEDFA